jgi:hypothetical protein
VHRGDTEAWGIKELTTACSAPLPAVQCDNVFVNGASGVIKIGDLGLATLWRGLTTPQSVLGGWQMGCMPAGVQEARGQTPGVAAQHRTACTPA